MGFLKRNWFLLLCSLVSVASIGMMVTFVGCMGQIESQIGEAASLYDTLDRLANTPQNPDTISHIEAITQRDKNEQSRVLEDSILSNVREPLRDDTFPRMANRNKVPYDFRNDYRQAFQSMMRTLNPAAPPDMKNFDAPNAEDIANWEEELVRRRAEEAERSAKASASPTPAAQRSRATTFSQAQARAARTQNLSPEQEARENPVQMASIEKARSLYCYVGPGSFQVHELYYESGTFEEPDMWAAQVLLWIQQDVVNAIAKLNTEAAEAITGHNETLPAGTKPWPADVTTMPVKHLISIELALPDEVYQVGADSQDAADLGLGILTYTDRGSSELYDVIPFTVIVAVDQRDLTQVIDRLSQANLYTPLNVNWNTASLPPGYLYGHEPVVYAELEFEGYFFREAYHHRLPKDQPDPADPDAPELVLEDHPLMPDMVRAGVEQGIGMMSLHRGFAQPAGPQGGALGVGQRPGMAPFSPGGGLGGRAQRHGGR